ncbi:hypothetical protein Hanom_Chr11g00984961 [Helianthus anomalus]
MKTLKSNLVSGDEEIVCESEQELRTFQSTEPEKQLPIITTERLAKILQTLQGNLRNPPPMLSSAIEEQVAEEDMLDTSVVTNKIKCNDLRPDLVEQQPIELQNSPIEGVSHVEEIPTSSNKESKLNPMFTSVLVQDYATGSSSGAKPKIPENTWMGPSVADIYGRETRKVLVIDDFIDEDEVDIVSLRKKVIVLEQDSIMKDAKIVNLEYHMEEKDRKIEQLEGAVTMLISLVYDLKGKLKKKFDEEFTDEGDKESYEARLELAPEDHARLNAEKDVALQQYLDTPHPKKIAPPPKNKKRIVVMKNQNVNPLDDNSDPVDPSEVPNTYVMDIGESLYDKVGNKSSIISSRYDHYKMTWMIARANQS